MEVTLEEKRVPAPQQHPPAKVPGLGREFPITPGCENQGDCGRLRHKAVGVLRLKNLHWKGSRNIWGATELSNKGSSKVIVGGNELFSEGSGLSHRQKCWQGPLCLFLSSSPQSQQEDTIYESLLIWLKLFAHPGDSLRPHTPPNF